MTHAHGTAQAAEDAMLFKQGCLQLAQVKYNDDKINNEIKLSIHFLDLFKAAFKHMEDVIAKQKAAQSKAEKRQRLITDLSIGGAIVACAFGQPEVAALIITTTMLSNIKTNVKDKNGNKLSAMGFLVQDIAKHLPGGDTAKNELFATLIIAAVLTIVTCGIGGAFGAADVEVGEEGGSLLASRLSAFGERSAMDSPIASTLALGGSGFADKAAKAIIADKKTMAWCENAINGIVTYINTTYGANIELPSEKVDEIIVTITINVLFLIVSLGAGLASLKMLGGESTMIAMLGRKLGSISRSTASASEDAAVVSEAAEGAGNSASSFSEVVDKAVQTVEDEGTELQEIASMATRGAGDGGEQIVEAPREDVLNSISATEEDLASGGGEAAKSSGNVVRRALSRMAGITSKMTTYMCTHPFTTFGAIVGLVNFVQIFVSSYEQIQLGMIDLKQADLILEKGRYGVQKNESTFQLKMFEALTNNDNKILKTQWDGDAALQNELSRFADGTNAIAEMLV